VPEKSNAVNCTNFHGQGVLHNIWLGVLQSIWPGVVLLHSIWLGAALETCN